MWLAVGKRKPNHRNVYSRAGNLISFSFIRLCQSNGFVQQRSIQMSSRKSTQLSPIRMSTVCSNLFIAQRYHQLWSFVSSEVSRFCEGFFHRQKFQAGRTVGKTSWTSENFELYRHDRPIRTIEHFQIEIQKLPHPPCNVEVPVVCIGGHESVLWPCWNSQPLSCGRKCGRQLICGNHFCQNQCHSVTDLNAKMQDDLCAPCQEDCIFQRTNGCIHPCEQPCHTGDCDVCLANIKTVCHCGLTQVYYKCGEYYRNEIDENVLSIEREKMKSCGNRCIKNVS